MGVWKQVIVSQSNAALNSLGVGTLAAVGAGNISASGKLYTEGAAEDTTINGELNVLVYDSANSNKEIMITGSTIFSDAFANSLTAGPGTTAAGTYNGGSSGAITIGLNSSSLAGNGLRATNGALQTQAIGLFTGITFESTGIGLTTGYNADPSEGVQEDTGIVDDTRGLEWLPEAVGGVGQTRIGLKVGSGVKLVQTSISGSKELAKKAPNESGGAKGQNFTAGTNLAITATYDMSNSSNPKLSINSASMAGSGLEADVVTDAIVVGGTNALTANRGVNWNASNRRFANYAGVIYGTNTIDIGEPGHKALISGDFKSEGSTNFAHSDTLGIADQFILVNSSSATPNSYNPFGFKGELSTTQAMNFHWTGSSASPGGRFVFGTGSVSGNVGLTPTQIMGHQRLHIGGIADSADFLGANGLADGYKEQAGYTLVHTGASLDLDGLYIYVDDIYA